MNVTLNTPINFTLSETNQYQEFFTIAPPHNADSSVFFNEVKLTFVLDTGEQRHVTVGVPWAFGWATLGTVEGIVVDFPKFGPYTTKATFSQTSVHVQPLAIDPTIDCAVAVSFYLSDGGVFRPA